MHSHSWFEMVDILRTPFVDNTWVPIWLSRLVRNNLPYGSVGFYEEFNALGALVVFPEYWENMRQLEFYEIGPNIDHRPWKNNGVYNRPMEYVENNVSMGEYLVVQQQFEQDEPPILRINQDLILALRIKEENKKLVRPEEGYEPVIQVKQDDDGNDCEVDIKLPFLKDYLCARGCRLLIKEFFQRNEFVPNLEHIPLFKKGESGIERTSENWRWECRYKPVDKNGNFIFGSKIYTEVVGIQQNAENHFGVFSDLWRTEFILPGEKSARVLLDDESGLSFIASPDGTTKTAAELNYPPQWLYFKGGIIPNLLEIRNSKLVWYTKDTGAIHFGNVSVCFGVNDIGLVSVLAKDIVDLSDELQSRWRGYNVVPEGGPSRELIDSQMCCAPASTKAPECLLPELLGDINVLFQSQYGDLLFLEQDSRQELIRSIHRFRVQTNNDIFALAKDVVRLTTDSINIQILRQLLSSKGIAQPDLNKIGSNKLLESFWTLLDSDASRRIAPLFYLYDVRLGDSHPLAEKSQIAARKLGLNTDVPLVKQGELIIEAAVGVLCLLYQSLLDKSSTNHKTEPRHVAGGGRGEADRIEETK